MTDPKPFEDDCFPAQPPPPPNSSSAAALRDAVESAEDESLDEGEGRDQHR